MGYYAKVTDEEILSLILSGVIVIRRLITCSPVLYVAGRKVKAHTYRSNHPNSIRRYYWKISDGTANNGKRRRRLISRAKLVWMYYNQQLVPPEHEVHHINEQCLDDSCDNLEAKHVDDHKAHHRRR